MKLSQAIHNLRPNTEWTLSGDDYENIVWHTSGVEPISKEELDAELNRLKEIETQKPILKAALLDRLGLTEEEAKLLLA